MPNLLNKPLNPTDTIKQVRADTRFASLKPTNYMGPAAGNNDGEVTVFISTSLDTSLLTTVSASDTVSDFKKKIMLEHRQCFPSIGNIIIHSLKVKRRGVFYHLSDSMLVRSVFQTTKGDLFVSVDASTLEQDIDIQHIDKHKVGDQLALPWVTHDNHGSLSIQTKTAPFVDHMISNVDGDSYRDVSKNLKEDGSSDGKQLAINKEINSKKRTRDVSDENLLKDPSGCELSVKKKRKTQRVKSSVKASEGTMVSTHDNDKVKDKGVSMNCENTFEHKSKDKDCVGESTRINDGEKRYDLDQVSATVPSSLEGVGRETVADVAMVAAKSIQHGMSENEKEIELVQKEVMENEIPSLSMRTSECEHDATGLTVVGPLKGCSKHSTKHNAAEEEVASTSFVKKLHNINKDAIDSSRQDVGSNGQDSRGDLIYKHKEDREFPLKQGPEVRLPERRKKVKKSAAKIKKETPVMHADDNHVGDISSTVYAPILDEKVIGEKNEGLETLIVDSKKNDEMIVKEIEVSEPTKRSRSRVCVENMEEKSENKSKDIVGSRKRKKDIEKTALKNDESVVKQFDDVATSIDALHVDCVRNDDILMNNDAELLGTVKSLGDVKVDNIDDISEKQNEKMDGIKKNTRKKKTKKSASRNEDESITKHVKVEISDNVKKDDSSLPDGDRKDEQQFYEGLVGKAKINKKSSLTGPQDRFCKLQSTEATLESKKNLSIDHRHHLEVTSKNVTVSEVCKDNNEVNVTNAGSHEINFMDHFAPDQADKISSIDSRKDTRKPKKKTEDDSRNDGDIRSQKIISKNEGLDGKTKKKNKSSLTGPQDRLSKLQSTEAELESNKSQSIDHNHHLEDASKIVTGSEVSKVNNEVCITNDGSSEINFMDHFARGHQSNKIASIENGKDKKKTKMKTKDNSRNGGGIRSQKLISKNKDNKAITDPNIPNIDQLKTPRMTINIDAESSSSSKSFGRSFRHRKSNKQQSAVGPVKNNLPVVNSLLNTPGNIFGDDESDRSSADDNAAVNSDCSTRTPSRKLTSSSGESDSSIDLRRNRSFAIKRKGGGKNSRTSENESKKVSMADLLRSSSRFKKAKFTASQQVEDSESQPVDFVPESQPLG